MKVTFASNNTYTGRSCLNDNYFVSVIEGALHIPQGAGRVRVTK